MHRASNSCRILSLFLAVCLTISCLIGCGINSQHLEMTYDENSNEDIQSWDSAETSDTTTWENASVVYWSDVDEYSDCVYSAVLFEDITDEMPLIECQVFDYQKNGTYFDGEKVYRLVGDKFDVNSFAANYATGTGVIIICVILNVVTSGASTPVACFIAGAADASVSMALKGAAFGAATSAIMRAIKSDGDLEEAFYGALEGSAEGYKWGAIYGAITGGFNSKYCFTGETLVETPSGLRPIRDVQIGDYIRAYDKQNNRFSYTRITQREENTANELLCIIVGDEVIRCTPEHPFLTDRGWVTAIDLEPGMHVRTETNGFLVITNVDRSLCRNPATIYSLCVENYHNYLVGSNGIIVHNRCNPNEKRAGTTRHFEDKPEINEKYPDGVFIKQNGYPDFSPYAIATVQFDPPSVAGVQAGKCLRGDTYYDPKMANKIAFGIDSLSATPKGFTWHHNEDCITMELIPTDLHRALNHDGGEKLIKQLLSIP